jgi:phytoene synthase
MRVITNIEQAKIYCYDKAAKPDTALYYSLRNLTSAERDLAVALHAFYQEIENVIFECKDQELAMKKFNWWRSEVAKLSLGKPDHPVMLVLQASVPQLEKIQEKLLTIIAAIEQNLFPASFEKFEDVVIHFMRTAGQRELLIHELLGNNKKNNDKAVSEETIYQLMLVVELVNYVQHLHDYAKRDIIYFPLDELTQFQVSNAMLHELKTTVEIKNLLQFQAEKVERAYAKAMSDLTRAQRAELSHLLIRCEIARKTLREIQASDFMVLENLISLTPLRYWWIAWRS